MHSHTPQSRHEHVLRDAEPLLTSRARQELRLQKKLDAATTAVLQQQSARGVALDKELHAARQRADAQLARAMGADHSLTLPGEAAALSNSAQPRVAAPVVNSSSSLPHGAARRVLPQAPLPRGSGDFTRGFPTSFTESGFESVVQWARTSFEEARVLALGPRGDYNALRTQQALSQGDEPRCRADRTLAAVSCYLLQEVLSRDAALRSLWELLRLPILDAVFSDTRVGSTAAAATQKQSQTRVLTAEPSVDGGGNGSSTHKSSRPDHAPAAAAAAPAFTDLHDFAAYRLWCEELRSTHKSAAAAQVRCTELHRACDLGERVLAHNEWRLQRSQLRAVFLSWRGYVRRDGAAQRAAAGFAAHTRTRAGVERYFLRWRRFTVRARNDRLQDEISSLHTTLQQQQATHSRAMELAHEKTATELAVRDTQLRMNDTLRSQLVEHASFECSVLHAALANVRERSALFELHARRWERLAKTLRPLVRCPTPSPALRALGGQLRRWESDLTRCAKVTASITTRQHTAAAASLQQFLLRWVNYIMTQPRGKANDGGGGGDIGADAGQKAGAASGESGAPPRLAFWIPVKALEPYRYKDAAAAAAGAAAGAKSTKNEGVSSSKIKAALGGLAAMRQLEEEERSRAAAAAAANVAADGPVGNYFTMFSLRCLVQELRRQCPSTTAGAPSRPLKSASPSTRPPLSSASLSHDAATVTSPFGEKSALVPHAGAAPTGALSGLWQEELEAVAASRHAQATAAGASAPSTPAARVTRQVSFRRTHDDARDGEEVAPHVSGAGADALALNPALNPRAPVFAELSQLLMAYSGNGLNIPLLAFSTHSAGARVPTAAQLHEFIFPSATLAKYGHRAMLWVLASLFVGYAQQQQSPPTWWADGLVAAAPGVNASRPSSAVALRPASCGGGLPRRGGSGGVRVRNVDTAADVDVYLGLAEANVPPSDADAAVDAERAEEAQEEALDVAVAAVTAAEEAALERRRWQRLLRSGLLAPADARRLRVMLRAAAPGTAAEHNPPRLQPLSEIMATLAPGGDDGNDVDDDDADGLLLSGHTDSEEDAEEGELQQTAASSDTDAASASGDVDGRRRQQQARASGGLDAGEAKFWEEDELSDLSSGDDTNHSAGEGERSESFSIVHGSVLPRTSTAASGHAPSSRPGSSSGSHRFMPLMETLRQRQRASRDDDLLRMLLPRSVAFDYVPHTAGGAGKRRREQAQTIASAVGERTERRREERSRRRGLAAFVELSLTDEESRRCWYSLARVIVVLVTSLGVLGSVWPRKDGGGGSGGPPKTVAAAGGTSADTPDARQSPRPPRGGRGIGESHTVALGDSLHSFSLSSVASVHAAGAAAAAARLSSSAAQDSSPIRSSSATRSGRATVPWEEQHSRPGSGIGFFTRPAPLLPGGDETPLRRLPSALKERGATEAAPVDLAHATPLAVAQAAAEASAASFRLDSTAPPPPARALAGRSPVSSARGAAASPPQQPQQPQQLLSHASSEALRHGRPPSARVSGSVELSATAPASTALAGPQHRLSHAGSSTGARERQPQSQPQPLAPAGVVLRGSLEPLVVRPAVPYTAPPPGAANGAFGKPQFALTERRRRL